MKTLGCNEQQLQKMKSSPGFIAALDQSGGSTPHALRDYGIKEDAWSNEEEMFAIVHQMRTRIITSPSFTGERIIGAILFENTMDRDIQGQPTADYLWNVKRVVPFLKIDKGLAAEKDGVQLMKPMPELAALLDKAKAKRIFGTEDALGHQASQRGGHQGHRRTSSSKSLARSSPPASCRSSSRKSIFTARKKRRPKRCSKRPSSKSSTNCRRVSWSCSSSRCRSKTTSTPIASAIPRSCRVVALSGGYTREEANERLRRNHGIVASFSRALVEGLSAQQSDAEFNALLDRSIQSIFEASNT